MIAEYKTIDLYGKPLFTWVSMETPQAGPVPLPAEACCVYIMDGDDQNLVREVDITAKAGQVILSLCGTTVGRMLAKQERGKINTIVVHFHADLLLKVYRDSPPPFWKELESPVVEYIVQTAATELVKKYFEGVTHLFEHLEAVSEAILVLKLQEIILLLLQTENSPQITQIMRSLFSKRTFSFKEVVDAHICSPVTLEDLATLTNCSLSSFKREFKKIYESPPGQYIMDKRTEKVAELLRVSDEAISRIGYQCGFSSAAHLSRTFKAKYGVTPSEYRLNRSVN